MDKIYTGLNSGGATLGAFAGQQFAVDQAEPQSGPFITAAIAFQQTYELCRRVRELANRTVGAVPTPVTNGATAAGQPPTFAALQGAAEAALNEIAEATEALNRIERSLP